MSWRAPAPLSVHGQSAGDADRLSGDEPRIVAQEEGDNPWVVVGSTDTPHRNGPRHRLADLMARGRCLLKAVEKRRVGGSGANRIQVHGSSGHLGAGGLREGSTNA